ncbi:enoyl-CoA hydratase [Trinickia caryophylli]|uniref:Enoyl-CoA hydratase domain-containing protein 3, mitochondrial n=1 Tax=Trinickia caryophylli TaxID=28094 RepID=A0A1X7DVX9_TRICW|nr:enoyl-CoA hydratase [Trinickia caryophylli]PMS14238.1 enoyl-CoA hydratase [Trinickia caryophylli]TRX17937.1 enoyl-CoA hydratase [Trinickia caryophylli]WQE11288.1 enoyl-CoA hydratase [Trinickia caryophylli]SMF22838.1 Enoyl-CoA hydratase/carnithine racemase [Trinickia caryophylli]GLU32437.1 enoyl-CoA hydratase [Trinickia caryophylli]
MNVNESLPVPSGGTPGAGVLQIEHAAYGLPGVVRLTLNRPDAFNALSEQLIAELHAALKTLAASEARVVVIAAAGRAFCAGHDLKEMRATPTLEYYQALFTRCSALMLTIQRMPQPVIARVQGTATAAGCQLVAMCDLAVAADTARFAVSGINVGLFCATPAVPLSRNVSRKAAFEMLMTGEFIDAAQAREQGLINSMAPLDALDAEVVRLASSICAKPAAAVRAGKALFYRQIETGIEAAYQLAGQTMACNAIDEATQEGLQAFVEKRPPNWKR